MENKEKKIQNTSKTIQNTYKKTDHGRQGLGFDIQIRKKMGSDEKGKGMAETLGKTRKKGSS